jgi:acetylornithine aminotransferase
LRACSNNEKGAIITPDPGADSVSAAFVNERAPYLVPTYVRPAPIMVKGQGCYLWDMENRRYLDLTAGIAVNSLGHCDPEISKIIAEQVRTQAYILYIQTS